MSVEYHIFLIYAPTLEEYKRCLLCCKKHCFRYQFEDNIIINDNNKNQKHSSKMSTFGNHINCCPKENKPCNFN